MGINFKFSDVLYHPPAYQTLGIPRSEMPQVAGEHVQDFLKWSGFKYRQIQNFSPIMLKATQRDFNMEKVKGMMDNPNITKKPIMISNDYYVVDGHHRWLAVHNSKQRLPVIKIDAPIHDILKRIAAYPKTFNKTISEQIIGE